MPEEADCSAAVLATPKDDGLGQPATGGVAMLRVGGAGNRKRFGQRVDPEIGPSQHGEHLGDWVQQHLALFPATRHRMVPADGYGVDKTGRS